NRNLNQVNMSEQEFEGGGPRCLLPPAWKIGDVEPMKGAMGRVTVVALLQAIMVSDGFLLNRMDGLHQQLESEGLKNVTYMVVNHQGVQAQRLHTMMAQRLSENITLYKQDEQQPDVWQTLRGDKDDFLIYDRCGRLTHHISLPYSIIGQGHIEGAIRDAYCQRTCGECAYESAEIPEECKQKSDAQPGTSAVDDTGHGHGHDHGHGHHHGHHHGHGHHHHGADQGFHPRGFGHGHDHNHGQHQGHHDAGHGSDNVQTQSQHNIGAQGHQQDSRMSQMQHHFDLAQIPHVVHMQQMPHDAHGAPARP
uniref:Selenoprotein P n=1 Tax=Acanthochromis polyacanthus TaxID=80966 RepID=A0A3Q1F139_9TELE